MRPLLAALVFAAPLYAQNCTFAVTPTSFKVPYTAGTGYTITVTVTPANCNQGWVATPQVNWLHPNPANVNGSGTTTISVDANTVGAIRSGIVSVANTPVTVTQDPAPCKFGLGPSSENFPVTGGPGSVSVQANCGWQASTDSPQWISIPFAGSGGTTDAAVQFTVFGNGCLGGRSGSIRVAGSGLAQPLITTITQDGSPANFTLSATSAAADSTASDNRFTVSTGTGCGWSASSDVSWMQITSGSNGSGNGGIAYHLVANTSAARTGNIHVTASPTTQYLYTVTQSAAGPPAPQLNSVNNAANYAADAVSPGEIVTLFGQNMGPATLAPLQVIGGSLTFTLSGTQVLFDSVAAPMIYTRQDQVSAIAPYGLNGKTSTQVQVSYNGTLSNSVTVPVKPATPAIFTLDTSGLGPGAILNQDTFLNGSSNPAARGSVVAIYATGGGTTSPSGADGAIIGVGTLPRLTLPVSVTIGGADAQVSYSGGVPGSIAGLTQINAEIPASIAPGAKIPVTIKVGDTSSTSGVTIAVR